MRAAVLHRYGTPCSTDFVEPQPREGMAVVEVSAGGLNPIDLAIAAGVIPSLSPRLPFVCGREGVGTIDGRRVYFSSAVAPFGSFAERALVEPRSIVDLEASVPADVALACGIAGLAGWLALSFRAQLGRGEHVLVLGAGGSVGRVAVQAARLLGAGRVVAADRSADGLRRAEELGADATFLLDSPSDQLSARLKRACGNRLDVVVDPLWGWPAALALQATTRGARHVQLGSAAAPTLDLDPSPLRSPGTSILPFSVFASPPEKRAEAHAEMCRHAVAGRLHADTEGFPLEAVGEAFERQRTGTRRKIVIVP